MKTLGIILLVAGAILLVFGVIDYASDDTILQMGSVEVEAEDNTIGWPIIAGAIAFLAGLVLVAVRGRR